MKSLASSALVASCSSPPPAVPASSPVAPWRAVMEAAGVNDVLAKAIGTNNPHNVLRATMAGLAALRSADAVSEIRGMKLEAPRK